MSPPRNFSKWPITAGKHVYCEWPLGRNTDEAVQMLKSAQERSIRHAVGLHMSEDEEGTRERSPNTAGAL